MIDVYFVSVITSPFYLFSFSAVECVANY